MFKVQGSVAWARHYAQESILKDAIKEAEEVCEGGAAGECAAAWDNVSGPEGCFSHAIQ